MLSPEQLYVWLQWTQKNTNMHAGHMKFWAMYGSGAACVWMRCGVYIEPKQPLNNSFTWLTTAKCCRHSVACEWEIKVSAWASNRMQPQSEHQRTYLSINNLHRHCNYLRLYVSTPCYSLCSSPSYTCIHVNVLQRAYYLTHTTHRLAVHHYQRKYLLSCFRTSSLFITGT